MRKVGDMKERVAGQIGDRKDVGTADIKEILIGMGNNWADGLPPLQAPVF